MLVHLEEAEVVPELKAKTIFKSHRTPSDGVKGDLAVYLTESE